MRIIPINTIHRALLLKFTVPEGMVFQKQPRDIHGNDSYKLFLFDTYVAEISEDHYGTHLYMVVPHSGFADALVALFNQMDAFVKAEQCRDDYKRQQDFAAAEKARQQDATDAINRFLNV